MNLRDLEEIAAEHLLTDKQNTATYSSLPGKIVLNLWYQWDCGCDGSYHSSCGRSRLVKSFSCEKPRIRVKAGREITDE